MSSPPLSTNAASSQVPCSAFGDGDVKLQKGWEGIEIRHFHVAAKTPRVSSF